MTGFDSDPFIIWSIRILVVMMLAFVTALMVRVILNAITGKLEFADVVIDPTTGKMSWKQLFGMGAAGSIIVAVMRDASDGTLSWELAAVVLSAAGLIELGNKGLNAFESVGIAKARATVQAEDGK